MTKCYASCIRLRINAVFVFLKLKSISYSGTTTHPRAVQASQGIHTCPTPLWTHLAKTTKCTPHAQVVLPHRSLFLSNLSLTHPSAYPHLNKQTASSIDYQIYDDEQCSSSYTSETYLPGCTSPFSGVYTYLYCANLPPSAPPMQSPSGPSRKSTAPSGALFLLPHFFLLRQLTSTNSPTYFPLLSLTSITSSYFASPRVTSTSLYFP